MDNFKRQFDVINMSEKVKYGQCQTQHQDQKLWILFTKLFQISRKKVKTDWHREEKGIA